MARVRSVTAELNFTFDNHAELTSMRDTVISFVESKNGTYILITSENEANEAVPYYGQLVMDIPIATRAEAATIMTAIDGALGSLPDLTDARGPALSYKFEEIEKS